ncbi:hypothetical protein KJ570_02635 [Patescibacteria group bacterium]|nr:hypothetical protein [Patescibacteria group bacterium]MBU2036179.1 hypothetical protein [Patescibacteria group bacterium]
MSKKTNILLTKGLKKGFVGKTVIQNAKRGGFNLKSSHFENNGNIYHDEWFADRAGGGQEIVKVGKTTYTRVYAGGTIPLEKLKALGISLDNVMTFLKKQITENGEKTRLHTDFEPEPEGDWQYSYSVLDKDKEIPLTFGKEVIKYKDQLVFVHDFIISPID